MKNACLVYSRIRPVPGGATDKRAYKVKVPVLNPADTLMERIASSGRVKFSGEEAKKRVSIVCIRGEKKYRYEPSEEYKKAYKKYTSLFKKRGSE